MVDFHQPTLSSPISLPTPAPEASMAESSHTTSLFTELSRHISADAAIGTMAAYGARPRSSSNASQAQSIHSISSEQNHSHPSRSIAFREPVSPIHHMHTRQKGPGLPRIDSVRTLPRNESSKTLPRSESSKTLSTSIAGSDIVGIPTLPYIPGGSESTTHTTTKEKHAYDENSSDDMALPSLSMIRKVLLGFVIMMDVFIASASANAVNLTLPSMSKDINISQIDASWVSSAYSLAYGCGLLFAGRMADIFGRKMLFLSGLAAAGIFSLIAGFLRDLIPLCIIRAMAGLGLALATPAGFGIIGVTFRQEPERTIAFATFGLGNPVGAAVGLVIGGAVSGIGRHGWSYLYFLLAGLILIPLVIGAIVIPVDRRKVDKNSRAIDWLGAFLITAAICLFTFSITESGVAPAGWKTPYIPALLVISIILLFAFGTWEHHLEHKTSIPPIAKLSLFSRNHFQVTCIILTAFLNFISVAGWVYLASLYYQDYKNFSPLDTAVHVLPACVCGTLASLAVMYVAPRFKAPFLLAFGGFLSAMACLLYAIEPPNTIYWACEFIALICLPFGADLTVGIGSILMSNLCEEDEQSVGGAIFQTACQIGAALGICLGSLVSESIYQSTGDYGKGLRDAFGMHVAWSGLVVVIALVFLRKMGLAKDVGHARFSH